MQIFPESNIELLEFDKVREWLVNTCSTERGKEYAETLEPKTHLPAIQNDLDIANDSLIIRTHGPNLPQMPDVRIKEVLQMLPIENSVVGAEAFHNLREFYFTFNIILVYFRKHRAAVPHFASVVDGLVPNKPVLKAIDEVLDQAGKVKSSASPKLASIRKQLEEQRSQAAKLFQKYIRDLQKEGKLDDLTETVSNDRRVLIVPSAYKRQIQGTIHGSTRSGQYTYIEPQGTVEINNVISRLLSDEQKEIYIIMKALTELVRPFYDEIYSRFEMYGYIDILRAKGELAFKMNANRPQVSKEKVIRLVDAVHPVLAKKNSVSGKTTIPLNVNLDLKKRLLVISGPNAGGKSVSLKTIGLLQIMVQSGLLVPCDAKSEFSVFQKLMADIGDSQSIENELSTYSSKLKLMKHFIEEANSNSIVLIDEFGTGSDPDLGGAIAEELLHYLNSVKCFGVITTHYGNIKVIAEELDGTINGNMRFNKDTLSPLYQLEIGRPGSSYTFEVARNVGLPQSIIDKARNRVRKDKFQFDKLLNQLQIEKEELKEIKTRFYNSGKQQEVSNRKVEDLSSKLEEKLKTQIAIHEKDSRYIEMGKKFEKMAEEFVRSTNKKVVMEKYFKSIEQLYVKQLDEVEKLKLKKAQKSDRKLQEQIKREAEIQRMPELHVGDVVFFFDSDQKGKIVAIQDDKLDVEIGIFRIQTTRDKIRVQQSNVPKAKQTRKPNHSNAVATKPDSKAIPNSSVTSKPPTV